MSPDPDLRERHDEIPPEHLATTIPKCCPACSHHWLAPKDQPDQPCPICKHLVGDGVKITIIGSPSKACAASDRLDPVLQPWVMKLPWKMQSILFSSLRGPDQEYLVNIKQVSKWMRSVTQNNADPSKPYMNNIQLPEVEKLYKELEHCPCHFVHHFLDGLAIIAYAHPDAKVSDYAATVHYACAEELFHFVPEMPQVFWLRHRDKRGGVDSLAGTWRDHEVDAKDSFFRAVSNLRANRRQLGQM